MADALLRFCVRHPTRVLFIGLLLLLVIFSRFLYPPIAEDKHLDSIRRMKDFSQQRAERGSRGRQNGMSTSEEEIPMPLLDLDANAEKSNSFNNEKPKSASQNPGVGQNEVEAKENKEEEKSGHLLSHFISEEEKAENELLRKKLPEEERFREHAGGKSPFETLEAEGREHENKKISEINLRPIPNEFDSANKVQAEEDVKKAVIGGKNDLSHDSYNVMMVLVKVGHTSPLAKRLRNCLVSICENASVNLTLHLVVDKLGKLSATNALIEACKTSKTHMNVTYYDIDKLVETIKPFTEPFQHLFTSSKNSYYNHPIFFMSTALHYVLPQYVHRIILLDADLLFKSDIKQLFAIFDNFKDTNIFGLAREQQPVYRHVFSTYRDRNQGTRIGEPPPDGLTGFNSGVLLVNLDKMRNTEEYKHLMKKDSLGQLADKYHFQGHLGDQDLYTLLNVEHSKLFYILPCSWNRQLCTFWRDHGYSNVFNLYYNCSEPVHVYHGNCKTAMPNESEF